MEDKDQFAQKLAIFFEGYGIMNIDEILNWSKHGVPVMDIHQKLANMLVKSLYPDTPSNMELDPRYVYDASQCAKEIANMRYIAVADITDAEILRPADLCSDHPALINNKKETLNIISIEKYGFDPNAISLNDCKIDRNFPIDQGLSVEGIDRGAEIKIEGMSASSQSAKNSYGGYYLIPFNKEAPTHFTQSDESS